MKTSLLFIYQHCIIDVRKVGIFERMRSMQNIIVENAKIMTKGQITLPKDIRDTLRVGAGDRVTLICEDDRVIMMNSAVYAMKVLQKEMTGEAEKAGLFSDDDVVDMVMEMRNESRV
jgi:AbrB family looped-hinge helix DNA binding protein